MKHRSMKLLTNENSTWEQTAPSAKLTAILFAVSLIFPWFSIRPNRISPAQSFSLFSAGNPGLLYILLPIVVSISLIGLSQVLLASRKTAVVWFQIILPMVGIVFGCSSVPLIERLHSNGIGEYSSIGIGIGWYVFVFASLLPVLSSKNSRALRILLTLTTFAVVLFVGSTGGFDRLGILREATSQADRLQSEIINHMLITLLATGISIAIGIPAAILAYLRPWARKLSFPFLNILQTIPSIALFGLMIAPLAALSRSLPFLRAIGIRGIGNAPAIIALSIYALYPIIRYSYTALIQVDPGVIDAGRGMGMSEWQIWQNIRIPLAGPGMLHGIRVAWIQTLGNATLAKLIGGSGLGIFVFEGLGQASSDMVLLGMFLIIGLTLISDAILQYGIFQITPTALRRQYER